MRPVLFMDEGERAEGGVSGEHQVPVRTRLGGGSPELGRLGGSGTGPCRSLHQPGLPIWAAHRGLQGGTANSLLISRALGLGKNFHVHAGH